jgi:hypothetical protein
MALPGNSRKVPCRYWKWTVVRPVGGGGIVANKEFNVLALIKGDERYIYVYDDVSRETLVEAFHAQAADPALSFNWFDAAVLTQKAEEQAAAPSPPGDGEKSARPSRF